MLPIDARLDNAINCLQKIVAVGLNVEADEIGAKQAVNQLPLPWTDAEGLRIWPRNVPEDSDTGIGPFFFDQPRHKRKVVVLYEDDGIFFVPDFFQQRLGKLRVDVLIVLPVTRAKKWP